MLNVRRMLSATPLALGKAGGLGAGGPTGLLFSAGIIGATNLVGYGVTVALQTHKITDLVGVGAFLVAAAAGTSARYPAWTAGGRLQLRPLLLNAAVGLWGSRLASYLFYRVLQTGEDARLRPFYPEPGEKWFDAKRANFPVNLAGFWTIQALWAWIVSFPVTLATFSPAAAPLGLMGKLAFAGFGVGFLVEAVADYQKFVFKSKPENKDRFIDTGLYSLCRFPNYLGEMVVWWSLFGAALPLLRHRPAHVLLGLASPLFLTTLLLKVSGIPMLEAQQDKRYGDNPAYRAYIERTPKLLPHWPF